MARKLIGAALIGWGLIWLGFGVFSAVVAAGQEDIAWTGEFFALFTTSMVFWHLLPSLFLVAIGAGVLWIGGR